MNFSCPYNARDTIFRQSPNCLMNVPFTHIPFRNGGLRSRQFATRTLKSSGSTTGGLVSCGDVRRLLLGRSPPEEVIARLADTAKGSHERDAPGQARPGESSARNRVPDYQERLSD